ncbi:MAG: hypothetical protein LCH86_07680 [Proteobacteria bacterium]|nr:hypothetical protein [Pseudomonadota bacterium]
MSLSAEAARLAAIECLAPTAALAGTASFPTLAGKRILDSRAVAVSDLIEGEKFTPVVSIYTRSADLRRRGETADYGAFEVQTVIEFVAELAIGAADENGVYADAMAGDDPDARLVLAALVAQIRQVLFDLPAGLIFRRIAVPERLECETFAVPELGLRWQRVTARLTCTIGDDAFADEGGLPEPIRELRASLPANSYAVERLDHLAGHFAPVARDPLQRIVIRNDEAGDPVAST